MSTTLAGSIKDLTTAAVTSNVYLRFILRGTNGITPRVNGTALVAMNPTPYPYLYYFDFTPDASGNFSGTLYSTRDAAGTGNGDIEVGGSLTAVWYDMVLYVSGQAGPAMAVHAKNGATLDPSNVTPITVTPVVSAGTGDTTYARLDGGNMPFTGQVLGKNGTVSSPGFAFASSASTGFWRQAADVIGVSIAGALKWLWNSAGMLFGSGGALGWSSNTDPSAAGGDLFLNRQSANTLGVGTTASNASGTVNAASYQIGGTGPTGSGGGLVRATSPTITTPTFNSGAIFPNGASAEFDDTTAPSGAASKSFLWSDSTDHRLKMKNNNGTAQLISAGSPNKQIFSSTGSSTFTIPAGVTAVKVTLIGAGGAAGGGTATANTGGAAGGSGAMAIKWLTGITPGNTISTSVGTGGTGTSGGAGNNGGNTTISSGTETITTVTAGGGSGGGAGAAGGAFGGPGGAGTNGDLNFSGNEGQFMIGNTNTGQNGTASPWGGGATRGAAAGANNGAAGASPGAGGSGGGGGTSNTTGGAGANGLIIFEWNT